MIPQTLSVHDQEIVYDAIAEAFDAAPADFRSVLLAKLAFTLANYVGDVDKVLAAIAAAARDSN